MDDRVGLQRRRRRGQLCGSDDRGNATGFDITLTAVDPAYRDSTNAWMARSRRTLEKYFDPTTARILDALVETSRVT